MEDNHVTAPPYDAPRIPEFVAVDDWAAAGCGWVADAEEVALEMLKEEADETWADVTTADPEIVWLAVEEIACEANDVEEPSEKTLGCVSVALAEPDDDEPDATVDGGDAVMLRLLMVNLGEALPLSPKSTRM